MSMECYGAQIIAQRRIPTFNKPHDKLNFRIFLLYSLDNRIKVSDIVGRLSLLKFVSR
jgi:hypothetical protein